MDRSKSSQLSPKSDWKLFGGRIPPELAKAARILSIKEDMSVQDLMIEALMDVLMKHGEEPPKKGESEAGNENRRYRKIQETSKR